MRTVQRAVLVAAAGLLLVSCSSDDDPAGPPGPAAVTATPTTPAAAGWPVCEDVWVAGAELPRDYDGCRFAAGGVWTANAWECLDGRTSIVSFRDRNLWAVPGRTIRRHPAGTWEDDEVFMKVLRRCSEREVGQDVGKDVARDEDRP